MPNSYLPPMSYQTGLNDLRYSPTGATYRPSTPIKPVAGVSDTSFLDQYGESYKGRSKPMSGDSKPTNYLGLAAGGLGLLGGLFGATKSRTLNESEFDYDPSRKADTRFKDLTDWNSDSNKQMFGQSMRLAGNLTPGADSLMAPIKGAGGGYLGSAAIAMQKAKGLAADSANSAFENWGKNIINNEGNASRYLGLEYERAKTQKEDYMAYQERQQSNQQDMWGEVANLGGTLLGMFV
jgi:hypothetical protein